MTGDGKMVEDDVTRRKQSVSVVMVVICSAA